MADEFANVAEGLDSPADNAAAVTPHATNTLEADIGVTKPRALYVGTGGSLVVHMANGAGTQAEVTFANVAAGSTLAIRPTRVLDTSTADNIVALW